MFVNMGRHQIKNKQTRTVLILLTKLYCSKLGPQNVEIFENSSTEHHSLFIVGKRYSNDTNTSGCMYDERRMELQLKYRDMRAGHVCVKAE